MNNGEINGILLEILRVGVLRIRGLASSGLAEACAVEADHLHNLPELIQSGRRELLEFYLEIERPAYVKRTKWNADQFHSLWQELDRLVESQKNPEGHPEAAAR